ncbi:hypothetical protein PG994_015105 [Apiospora phragmitis]|uniref:D-isomer specific 2-hydroxyacid dehydrogenase NAD-binding domain-containing protein n=1 Tax=Apiospora phragmitis TaxID=2905665 RepID=A0ABR1SVI7_9PEZI
MSKPIVLHIGEPIKYNHEFYTNEFCERFHVVLNDCPDRNTFMQALKDRKYGDFSAIYRPHFQTGGEMGQWDEELIALLPASALGGRGIWYANGTGASDEAVSDTDLYMILSVFRNFTHSQLAARTCDPAQFEEAHRLIATISANPRGHVLGLVGLGRISKRLAHKARAALGMAIHYHDVVRSPPEVEWELGAVFHPTLPGLLAVVDCVSLHTPLTAATRDLMDESAFAAMMPGARLVNTSRGPLVNEDALVAALRSGRLAAAALDVHYHEPHLAAMENVTLTTHVGGGALDTRINFELNAMKNILAVVGERS